MKLTNRDFGIVTPNLTASRDFYVNLLGFTEVFACDWYIHLKNGEVELGLLTPDHPSQHPAFKPAFPGTGIWVSFSVEDVDAEYERLRSLGAAIDEEPRDEPWGERHFVLRDPSGVAINLAKSIAPSAEFKESAAAYELV